MKTPRAQGLDGSYFEVAFTIRELVTLKRMTTKK
jgi:hypothetical protein